MKKLLFVIPNTGWLGMRSWAVMPYSLLILTALLKDRYELELLDANIGNLLPENAGERMLASAPDAVLVSVLSFEYAPQCSLAFEIAKKNIPNAILIAGGVHVTIQPEVVVEDKNIDFIFMGHAEERFPAFLEAVFNGKSDVLRQMHGIGFREADGTAFLNPLQTVPSDIKEMVKPDYFLFDIGSYTGSRENMGSHHLASKTALAPIITSYGCPNHCVFCANPLLSKRRVIFRPVEDVLEEIDFLHKEHSVGQFVFIDDCFLLKKKRVYKLLNAFIERGYHFTWKTSSVPAWLIEEDVLRLMKESGCHQISISVESGSQRVLDEIIHKPLKLDIIPRVVELCRKYEVKIGANFVLGFPGETWGEIRQSVKFAEDSDFDVVHFHLATPYPKTELYNIAMDGGLLPPDFSFEEVCFHGHGRGFITTDEFTPKELMVLRAYEWDRINFATDAKKKIVAEMYSMSLEQLEKHRQNTRRTMGLMAVS